MSKMKSKFKYMYDAAPASELIAKDGVAKTASFDGTAKVLDVLEGYWTAGELADDVFAVAINVTAVDLAADETYVLELEAGPVGFATSVVVGKVTIAGTGQYVILVDADTVKAQKADAAAIRLAGTIGGTTPSITLHAWIAGRIVGH
jgi:hypothetical protein